MTEVHVCNGFGYRMPVSGTALTTSAPATGNAIFKASPGSTFQLIAAAAATAIIEVTNEDATAAGTNSNWITMGTITLAGAGTDGFMTQACWKWVRARITAASAATSVLMGS